MQPSQKTVDAPSPIRRFIRCTAAEWSHAAQSAREIGLAWLLGMIVASVIAGTLAAVCLELLIEGVMP
jgi:UPF0716 family protein affecting phage T7 exclusion